MITGKEMYTVFSTVVPLYVAMLLAYGSVRWWGILTPVQCGGINRFVSIFAVPFLSFQFISSNNIYEMNVTFVTADVVSKFVVLFSLGLWARYSKRGSLEWMITMFMLITLPNTLVMGTPLLTAMYGVHEAQLTTQAVVLQSAIWYTLLLIMYEYRAAKTLIMQQFPDNAASILSFKVDSDVMSLDGREPVLTEAEVDIDGRLHVKIHRSDSMAHSSISVTPRVSNLTGAEIYSTHSSVNLTPRQSSFNQGEYYSMMAQSSPGHRGINLETDVYSLQNSGAPTPRNSSFNEESSKEFRLPHSGLSSNTNSFRFPPPMHRTRGTSSRLFMPRSGLAQGSDPGGDGSFRALIAPTMGPDVRNKFPGINTNITSSGGSSSQAVNLVFSPRASENSRKVKDAQRVSSRSTDVEDAKELHMFVWSENASPESDPAGGLHVFGGNRDNTLANPTRQSSVLQEVHMAHTHSDRGASGGNLRTNDECTQDLSRETLSFGNRSGLRAEDVEKDVRALANIKLDSSSSSTELAPKLPEDDTNKTMPTSSVIIKLICVMTFRKLIHNPNTYSTLLGVIWSLVAFRWNIDMPAIISNSYHIISDLGLGMAMFSLGLFMGLGDRIIACGAKLALFGMFLRFLVSPALFAAVGYLVGLRDVSLKVSIVQAALPQGIVPFVFAKEYNLHPDILSTAVIFGMLVALPVTLVYYILLGL